MNIQCLLLSQKKLIVFNLLQQTGRQIVQVTLMTVMIGGFVPLIPLASTAWAAADELLDSAQQNPTVDQERLELNITESLLLCKELGNVDAVNAAQTTLPCEVLELDITQSLLSDE